MALTLEQLVNMGVDLKEFDSYAHKVELARRRARYAAHPDKAVAQRERSSISFLRKQGYAVIDLKQLPEPEWGNSEPEWDEFTMTDFVNAGEEAWKEWHKSHKSLKKGACE